ncbi:MAG: glycosyltransferase family 2 protein [Chloroflexi bacterium]|nr:glycosyltransferase family 2 protein [Chloroflexota bacterium]MBL7118821.1 glycosyltransferase family 2 protein [Candidatus Bathyarchaeota archaeon]
MKICIVIPAYNAGNTLGQVFSRIPRGDYHRIIVVDDGSLDNTAEVARKHEVELIQHEQNRGYGGAQKTGFKRALELGADIMVLLHADAQYAPEEMPKLIEAAVDQNADIVLGSRALGGQMIKGGMPLIRYIGNRLLTKIENMVLGTSISEFHTGYRVYTANALKSLDFEDYTDQFHFDSEVLFDAKKKGLKIVEVPIGTTYAGEKSYLNPVTYGAQVLLLTLRYKLGKVFPKNREEEN